MCGNLDLCVAQRRWLMTQSIEMLTSLADDIWLRIFQYLPAVARIALERTCWALYRYSLDCPLLWNVTLEDRWYWQSPLPNEYPIHRKGVDGAVTIRRKVAAVYTFPQRQTLPKLYWKGEERLVLSMGDWFTNMETIALPAKWCWKGAGTIDRSPQPFIVWHTLCGTYAIRRKDDPRSIGPVFVDSCWNNDIPWCRVVGVKWRLRFVGSMG